MNFSDAPVLYRERLKNNAEVKSRTRDCWEQCIDARLKSWPGWNSFNVQDISAQDCEAWAGRFIGSATSFNNALVLCKRRSKSEAPCGA